MKNISRIFIANRGEIAVRIIQACKSLGLKTVVAVSEADRKSLVAYIADRAVCVGPPNRWLEDVFLTSLRGGNE